MVTYIAPTEQYIEEYMAKKNVHVQSELLLDEQNDSLATLNVWVFIEVLL
jgi:hypothetical protein